jgi:hypothetical protein
MNFLIPLEIF